MPKLTKRTVEALKPDPAKILKYWDSDLKGFGVVLLPSGRRTYCIQYRNQDRILKRLKIGVHGQVTTEEARSRAKKMLGNVANGQDPLAEKKEGRNLASFQQLTEDYIVRHLPKKSPKSAKEDKRMIQRDLLPFFGDQKVKNITRRDVESLQLKFQNNPTKANRLLSLLSKMMTLAVEWEWRSDHPARGIKRYKEGKRDRWLDKEELKRFWAVLDQYPHRLSAQLFKFLLLTGARKGEALNATWDQFDLKRGVWNKPSDQTKGRRPEYPPLSQKALEHLHVLKNMNPDSPFLFPGKVPGKPLQEVKTFWNRVIKEAELKDMTIHDLRHTYASHLASKGVSLHVIGALLGHTQAATTQRYAHLANQTLKDATELFGEMVA